jgi:hypothetical protein
VIWQILLWLLGLGFNLGSASYAPAVDGRSIDCFAGVSFASVFAISFPLNCVTRTVWPDSSLSLWLILAHFGSLGEYAQCREHLQKSPARNGIHVAAVPFMS